FRWIAIGVVAIGVGFAIATGGAPRQTIQVAQVANGILLPAIAILVLWAALTSTPQKVTLKPIQKWIAITVVTGVTALSIWKLVTFFAPS
ncbi:MAG: divalent metal cation transporter, partial [Planctomycetota bacterium]